MNIRVLRTACLTTGLQACGSSRICSVTENSRWWTYNCCLLICLHLAIGCDNRCGFLDTRTVSNSASFRSFLLSTCIDVPESTTNDLPRVSSKMVLAMTELRKARRTWLCPFLRAYEHFSPFPMHFSGRIVPVARFLPVFCPQTFEHNGYALEVRISEKLLAMGPFLSRFFMWCNVPSENRTLRFGPKNCVFFRKIDLDFGSSMSWNTQPNCVEFFNKATDPFTPFFFDFLLGWLSTSVCPKRHLSPNLHPDWVL